MRAHLATLVRRVGRVFEAYRWRADGLEHSTHPTESATQLSSCYRGGPKRISPLNGSPCRSFHLVFCSAVKSASNFSPELLRKSSIFLRVSSSGGWPGVKRSCIAFLVSWLIVWTLSFCSAFSPR